MSTENPPVVTIHLIDYDTNSWIWVPHIWPHEQFANPEAWADAASRTVAKRSGFRFLKRRALRDDLVQMALSRDGESTNWTIAYAPDLSMVPRIVRINAHDRFNGSYASLEQFLQLDQPGLHERPVVEPFGSSHLGDGITSIMHRKAPDGTMLAVRSYGWTLGGVRVSLSLADFDLGYLARIRPHVDALARALSFTISASGDVGAPEQAATSSGSDDGSAGRA